MLNWSTHARRRSAQRNVPADLIEVALAWGLLIPQKDGRQAWHLGFSEVSAARRAGVRIPERAIGLAVVVARDGTVVTVVRSHDRRRLVNNGRRGRLRRRTGGAR